MLMRSGSGFCMIEYTTFSGPQLRRNYRGSKRLAEIGPNQVNDSTGWIYFLVVIIYLQDKFSIFVPTGI